MVQSSPLWTRSRKCGSPNGNTTRRASGRSIERLFKHSTQSQSTAHIICTQIPRVSFIAAAKLLKVIRGRRRKQWRVLADRGVIKLLKYSANVCFASVLVFSIWASPFQPPSRLKRFPRFACHVSTLNFVVGNRDEASIIHLLARRSFQINGYKRRYGIVIITRFTIKYTLFII